MHIFIPFYYRTRSALPHCELPALVPGMTYRISLDFSRRDTKLRVLVRGGCSSGEGAQAAPFWRRVCRALTTRR